MTISKKLLRAASAALAAGCVFSTATKICQADTTITVTSLADSLSVSGQTTLRGAIQQADSDSGTDTIQFAPSLFSSGSATLALSGTELPITNSVNIVGPGQSALTINAQQFSRIFDVGNVSAQVNISGMTLTNGVAYTPNNGYGSSGGAIYNAGSMTLQNVTLSNNKSQSTFIAGSGVSWGGGAIYNYQGALTLQNCTVQNNSTTDLINGGGILSSGGSLNVQNSTFSKNTSGGRGGSIAASDGTYLTINGSTADASVDTTYYNDSNRASRVTITNSTLGAVSAYGTTNISNSKIASLSANESVTVSNSTLGPVQSASYINNANLYIGNSTVAQVTELSGNAAIKYSLFKGTANGAQAVVVSDSTATALLENDTVTGYQSTTGQGTLYFADGNAVIVRNSTIAGNQAGRGGGIFIASGTLRMDSSIVADNSATVVANDLSGYVSGQNNLVGDPTGAFLLDPNNLVGVNPELGPLADNGGPTETMALPLGSPAVDAGSNIDGLLVDQRGFSRVSGAGPDIGAYELQQTPEPAALSLLSVVGFLWLSQRRRPSSKY